MSNAIEDLFKDHDYCIAEIHRVRAALSAKDATQKTFDAAMDTLLFMRFYCPKSVEDFLAMQIAETETRQTYFHTGRVILSK